MFNDKGVIRILSILLLSGCFLNIKTVDEVHATGFKKRLSNMFSFGKSSPTSRLIIPSQMPGSISEGETSALKPKGFSQPNSERLINRIYTTGASYKRLLENAIKDYTGVVEKTDINDVYRFSGKNRGMNVYVDKSGNVTSVTIIRNGEIFTKNY